mmetsp:Transcript_10089/g.20282  ORF Transcript_10089/g.20282 Transcript_10089/m.20282 type:complete len:97 (+) Transcript_10089:998-1288(+)
MVGRAVGPGEDAAVGWAVGVAASADAAAVQTAAEQVPYLRGGKADEGHRGSFLAADHGAGPPEAVPVGRIVDAGLGGVVEDAVGGDGIATSERPEN